MNSVPVSQHRKDRKFRRIGKHTTPSQVEVAAQKAGKAVPTVAMAGALAVASQAHASPLLAQTAPAPARVIHSRLNAAVAAPARLTSVARPERAARPAYARHAHRRTHPARTYTVKPGDTLSGIAFHFYGSARAWRFLFQVNRAEIKNPNLIFPGQVLRVPRHLPASFGGIAEGSASAGSHTESTGALHGTLGCHALEALWRSAGGTPSAEVTAASIAMAESAGNQYATGLVGERGYWQINTNHGALSTYGAYGNARAAVKISGDGTDWSPWTTFVDGAYLGRC